MNSYFTILFFFRLGFILCYTYIFWFLLTEVNMSPTSVCYHRKTGKVSLPTFFKGAFGGSFEFWCIGPRLRAVRKKKQFEVILVQKD